MNTTSSTNPSRVQILIASWLIGGATILLTACGTPTPRNYELNYPPIWTATDMVDVAISDADRNRVDHFLNLGPNGFVTGPIWAGIFIGELGTSPVFIINSAYFDGNTTAAGFAARNRYVIDGTLQFDGREYPIHAEGSGVEVGLSFASLNKAVQRGVIDAAHKVKFIVTGGLKSQQAPPASHE